MQAQPPQQRHSQKILVQVVFRIPGGGESQKVRRGGARTFYQRNVRLELGLARGSGLLLTTLIALAAHLRDERKTRGPVKKRHRGNLGSAWSTNQ